MQKKITKNTFLHNKILHWFCNPVSIWLPQTQETNPLPTLFMSSTVVAFPLSLRHFGSEIYTTKCQWKRIKYSRSKNFTIIYWTGCLRRLYVAITWFYHKILDFDKKGHREYHFLTARHRSSRIGFDSTFLNEKKCKLSFLWNVNKLFHHTHTFNVDQLFGQTCSGTNFVPNLVSSF